MADLAHVYWLGGSACAGKTTVARLLAERHRLALYSCDDRFEDHRRRADPARHPAFCRLRDRTPKELWSPSAETQAQALLAFYEDEIEMVAEDLAAIPGPVLAEGVGLLPQRLAEWLAPAPRAAWLISSTAFRRRTYPGRGPWVDEMLAGCPDPARARARWMERDTRVAGVLEAAARSRGLPVVTVDGRRGVQEIADEVAERLQLKEA